MDTIAAIISTKQGRNKMSIFKCNGCIQIYEECYPPDDTCLKYKGGSTVRMVTNKTMIVNKPAILFSLVPCNAGIACVLALPIHLNNDKR
jgi:hypothetical protein